MKRIDYLKMTAMGILTSVVELAMILSAPAFFLPYGPYVNAPQWFIGLLIVLSVILTAVLLKNAGHKAGQEKPEPTVLKSVPTDIYILMGIIFSFLLAGMFTLLQLYGEYTALALFFLWRSVLSGVITVTETAVRIKTHTFITSTLLYMCLSLIIGWYKSVKEEIKYYFYATDRTRRNLLLICILAVGEILFFAICLPDGIHHFVICNIPLALFLAAYHMRRVIAYEKIREGIDRISQGETSYKVDTFNLPEDYVHQRNKLNNISSIVDSAVDNRLKSEKMKTELITNVSHDIKTPLTSIINYIDLIQKENITQQPLKDYLEVLQRQSARLKKLVDDLVEASKASTGNIPVHFADTGLILLLNQAIGEYSEKAAARGLEIAADLPEEEIYILSDGRILWRVFDNLLNNACKYSMPGTRIYVSAEKQEKKTLVTFRNISKAQLNISADELMERFVRGDSSRNTEGSGLGLSIAESLTKLLNGEMNLFIDGDLFKVVLAFDDM